MLSQLRCRSILASGLIIGASMGFASVAKAQVTDSGNVQGAIVPISIVDYSQPSSVNLAADAVTTNMNFGSVHIQSNNSTGWELTVDSTNNSTLLNGSTAIAYTGFEATGDGNTGLSAPVSLDVSTGAASIQDVSVLTCANTAGCGYTLTADIATTNGNPAGTYSDTLTFTLTNNP